jgi:thiamine-phosphate pyrophosphorylase
VAARAGWALTDLAEACMAGGARWLQLRAKTLSGGAFLETATRLQDLAGANGVQLIVNDRADVARLSGAAGVHVGQDDLAPAAARTIVGPNAVVGFSTHTETQIDAAVLQPVNYIAIGPVFGTATKETGYTAIGLDRVRYAAAAVARASSSDLDRTRDVVAIGGVTLDTAAAVLAAGATAVAVITDLLATGDPEARVRAYVECLGE